MSDAAAHRISIAPKTLALIAAGITACWLLVRLFPVVLVLVAAAILSGTLSPAVAWLEARRVRRGVAIAIVFTTLFAAIGGALVLTVPSLVEQLQTLAENESDMRSQVVHWLSRSAVTAPLGRYVRTLRYASLLSAGAEGALDLSTRALEVIAYVASAVFLSLYFLIDRDRLRGIVFALVPRRHHLRAARVTIELERIVGGYVRGQMLTSALMMGFVLALLAIAGIPNPLPIAVVAGAADVLPYVGVVLSVAPVAASAAPFGAGLVTIVVGAMLVYEEIESRFIIPRIYGSTLRLPSSVVLIALLAGGTLMGIVGALLALPVAAAVRMLVEELRVALPGEPEPPADALRRETELEAEYLGRAEGVSAERAAAIALELCARPVGLEAAPKATPEASRAPACEV